MRVLFYLPDEIAVGRARRNVALASRVAEMAPGASVLLAGGTDVVSRVGVPPGVEVLRLPGVSGDDSGHVGLRGCDLVALRAAMLRTLVSSYRPDVLIVDGHPLGANGELQPALDALRAMGRPAILGIHDVLGDRDTVMRLWPAAVHEAIARYYERVLVYGERTVFDPVESYGWPVNVAERLRFCGYMLTDVAAHDWREEAPPSFLTRRRSRPLVLATVGSEEDGFTVLNTFLEAAAGAPWDGAIVTGTNARPADRERLRRWAAEAGVDCLTLVPAMGRWFGAVAALVTTGGYGTVTSALATGLPTVCVPAAVPRSDHVLRARALARLGLVWAVDRLSPGALHSTIGLALAASRPRIAERARRMLEFNGAARAAEHLLDVAAERVLSR